MSIINYLDFPLTPENLENLMLATLAFGTIVIGVLGGIYRPGRESERAQRQRIRRRHRMRAYSRKYRA